MEQSALQSSWISSDAEHQPALAASERPRSVSPRSETTRSPPASLVFNPAHTIPETQPIQENLTAALSGAFERNPRRTTGALVTAILCAVILALVNIALEKK